MRVSVYTARTVAFEMALGGVCRVGRDEVAVGEHEAKVVNVLAVWHVTRACVVQPESLWDVFDEEREVLCSPPDCTLKALLVIAVHPPDLTVFGGVPLQLPDDGVCHLELSAKIEQSLGPLIEIGYLVAVKNVAVEDDVVGLVITNELDDRIK